MPITGTCHCGTVTFTLATQPKWMTACNCSLCRRLGTLWAHAPVDQVVITAPQDSTNRYISGAKTLAFHSCRTCGNTTHWENLTPQANDAIMAVNLRLAPAEITATLRLRHFDGADTWRFLD